MRNFIILLSLMFASLTFAQSAKLGKFDELTTNNPALDTIEISKNVDIDATGGVYIPNETTAERPVPLKEGLLRYKNETDQAEIYANGSWTSVGGGLSGWVTAKVYQIGDIVIESKQIYRCISAHTSGVFATDLAALRWEALPQELKTTSSPTFANETISGDITMSGAAFNNIKLGKPLS